jgi:hypothetical protein
MKKKKFIVFQYYSYAPSGGLEDISGDFDTIEEAMVLIDKAVEEDSYDVNIIIDRDTWKEIYSL